MWVQAGDTAAGLKFSLKQAREKSRRTAGRDGGERNQAVGVRSGWGQ